MAGFFDGWRAGLLPGAWRGIPFLCRDVSNTTGRRIVEFEFPDSNEVYNQDLGRGIKQYKLEIYVCGDDYMALRSALEEALDADGPGTLDHPYRGPLQVYAKHPCQVKELSEKGRAAYFECSFVEQGGPAPPVSQPDTANQSFTAAQSVSPQLASSYAGV